MGGSTAGSPHYEPLERLARGTGVSTKRLDQRLALYRAICAGAGAERPTDAAALGSWGSDRREDLEEIAAEMADSLKPEFYQALMALESVLVADEPPLTPQEDDLEAARDLAEEALTIAEKVSVGAITRPRLIAYALAHMAKVDSACGDPEEAAEKMQRARKMWQVGDGSDDLEEARFEALVGAGS